MSERVHPATFEQAREEIRHGEQRYKLQNAARTWLDDQGKGGAWAGTLEQVLAAIDRFYDCGTIGFVIDHT